MKVVMFAWGNPSRGDDAVGPWFAERYRSRENDNFTVIEDFQLQVEHLLDCREGDLLLFVDARCGGGSGYRFEQVKPTDSVSHTSHALAPAELLGQYQRLFASPPPPAFQLSIPGSRFELGQSMSGMTTASCEQATQLVDRLIAEPGGGTWKAQVAALSGGGHP